MNKKGGLTGLVIVIVLAVVLISFVIIPGIENMSEEIKNYKEYKEFCEDRPDFCYCEYFECSFMISFTNGDPSKDTRDYCEIAVRQEDKKAIFNGRCKR